MQSNCFSIPGIRRIGYIACRNLPDDLPMLALSETPIVISATVNDVVFFGEPTCENVETNENNGTTETVTLDFKTTERISLKEGIAFVVTDQHGQDYLIGTKEKPYPLIESKNAFGAPSGDSHARAYTVKMSAVCALMACQIL